MKFLFSIVLIIISFVGNSQLNIDSLSHINYRQLHNANLNDVWGYVDEFGNEYAIVGTSKGTSIVNITNPNTPHEIVWIPGTESIWRDPSVHGDYAYITTEAHDGLLIIDLTPLPQSTNLLFTYYTGPTENSWQSAHTCFVDENGYAYIFGSNRGNRGAIILDVHTNPMNPIEVGVFDNWYVHDGFVRNDTMYLAHILDGFFSLVNVSNKSNPTLINTKTTPGYFTHNIWPTNNGSYVFTTDEVTGAYITSYNIEDPSNIKEEDRAQNSPGSGVIPHNTHVLHNYLITSYYSDGITIHDITYPHNIIKVGSYDTYPGQTTWYDGCWGVYPFFPSGTIIAADITEGLFILKPTYRQAAYLEGIVTDSVTGNPLENVNVQIISNEQIDQTNTNGHYATGRLNEGICSVEFSKPGYYTEIIDVLLITGNIIIKNIALKPLPVYNFSIHVIDSITGESIPEVQLLLESELTKHTGQTNGIGQEDFKLYYQEYYKIIVGKWGYETKCFYLFIDSLSMIETIELQRGFYDEFIFDYGWISSGTAKTGWWERGEPNPTSSGSAPKYDVDNDCGSEAYVTGNKPALNPDYDDVDGFVKLTSPTMDLSTYEDPYLNFSKWFYCDKIHQPDDTLNVFISNGTKSVKVCAFHSDTADLFKWRTKSIRIKDFIELSESMQVSFEISDQDPTQNITEAGIDRFFISKFDVTQQLNIHSDVQLIYPNPFDQSITLEGFEEGKSYSIYTAQGQLIMSGVINQSFNNLNLQQTASGLYLIKVGNRTYRIMKQ